jgi:dTDP-4-amino-4,6-dideoxygalactose transaminase
VQAVVANHILDRVNPWIDRRIEIAARLDKGLGDLAQITVPPRPANRRHAFALYMIRAERRDALVGHLNRVGVETKVHYPTPLHLQPAAQDLGYGKGDFPMAEAQAADLVTLPNHQYLTDDEIDYMIDRVRRFYRQ